MASIPEMKQKVAIGVERLHEADTLLNAAGVKFEEALAIWSTVSDNPQLSAAISTLQQAIQEVERVIVQKGSAVTQAENYAAGL